MKVPWVDAVRYPAFLAETQQRLQEAVGELARVELTGRSALLGRTYTALVHSMGRSYGIAFLLIAPLLVLFVGSLRLGALALVPNLVPIALTLGLMGWLDVPLDVFTLLIGGTILGLAVDDTIHFMYTFRRYRDASGDTRQAVRQTLETTGTALLFTTLVLASGFLVFVLAYMLNLRSFGLIAGFATLAAFLADVLLAPALVARWSRPTPVAEGRNAGGLQE